MTAVTVIVQVSTDVVDGSGSIGTVAGSYQTVAFSPALDIATVGERPTDAPGPLPSGSPGLPIGSISIDAGQMVTGAIVALTPFGIGNTLARSWSTSPGPR